MCGSKRNRAAEQARKDEQERQAKITEATNTINNIFNGPDGQGRAGMYRGHASNVFNLNRRAIEDEAQDAIRQNKFGLARSGLMGGSVDIDSKADINERTNQGLLYAGSAAAQAAADMQMNDEQMRQTLLSMAQSGVDTGTVQTMALNGIRANQEAAKGGQYGYLVSGLFDDLGQTYLYNQQMQGGRMVAPKGEQWYGVSRPSQTYGGSVSR